MSGLTRLLLLFTPVVFITFGFSMIGEAEIESFNTIASAQAFAIAGSLFGIFFFMVSEVGMADSNRSYVANPLTDILAFIGTGWLIMRAYNLEEGVLIGVGCAIFVIHILQLAFKQGFSFDSPGDSFWR